MKAFINILSVSVAVLSLMFIARCGADDGPTAQETQLKKLEAKKTWKIGSVKIDGVDHTGLFSGMTLSITKNSFSSTHGGTVWPPSGSWEFADAQGTTITRGDNLSITIEDVTDSELRLSLQWNETSFGPGRSRSLSGTHVFSFN